MGMNPRLLRPTASGFDPRRISGLQLWLDAADLSTMAQGSNGTTAATADGDPVGYWADKSGNGRHARQTINNNRPTLKTPDINGRHGLDFDGSNDSFLCDVGAAYAARSVYAVVRRTADSFGQWASIIRIRATGNAAGVPDSAQNLNLGRIQTSDVKFLGASYTTNFLARRNGQSVSTVNSLFFNIFHAELVPDTTSTSIILVDGTSAPVSGSQYTHIGLDPGSPTRCYPMRLHELLLYDTLPNAAVYSRVERYLSQKWGIPLA